MRLLIAGAALALAGCAAPSWHGQAKQMLDRGDCAGARGLIYANESDPAHINGMVGATYMDCDRNTAEGVRHFTLAARYGNQMAQQQLASMGEPVPSPDLRGQSVSAGGPLNAFIRGYNGGSSWPYPGGGSQDVTCDARRNTMGPSTMDQRYRINCR